MSADPSLTPVADRPLPGANVASTASAAPRASDVSEVPVSSEIRLRADWRRQYAFVLLVADVAALLGAAGAIRVFGDPNAADTSLLHFAGAVSWIVCALLLMFFVSGAYEVRDLSLGVEEARRVLRAAATAFGISCAAIALSHTYVSTSELLLYAASALAGLGTARLLVRRLVTRRRRSGAWVDRVLAVGTAQAVEELARTIGRRPGSMTVVGACVHDPDNLSDLKPFPVLGGWNDTLQAASLIDADIVTITGSGLGPRAVRELSWALEHSGRQLVTATELAEIASSRIQVRPVDGLPLVWVEHPRFTGPSRFVKRTLDVAGAFVGLLIASPILVTVAVAIKATSSGPVFFKQKRLGKNGATISVWKFRTMCDGAEKQLTSLLEHNTGSNLLYFKMQGDPRITPIGRLLRRWSLDELPQLLNVFGGSMSLVGPRPLPGTLDMCEGDYRRRLLVRPGLTGLWQVSGRSDLSTDDALRLDLYYVENWSLGLDFAILGRTIGAVVASRGAY